MNKKKEEMLSFSEQIKKIAEYAHNTQKPTELSEEKINSQNIDKNINTK